MEAAVARAHSVSVRGIESPLKTWGLFKRRRVWLGACGAAAIGRSWGRLS